MKKLILSLFALSSATSMAYAATVFTIGTDFGDAEGTFNNSTIPFNDLAGLGVTVSDWQSKGSSPFTNLDSNAVGAGGMGDFPGTMRGQGSMDSADLAAFGDPLSGDGNLLDASTQHAFFTVTIPEGVTLDLLSLEFLYRTGGNNERHLAVGTSLTDTIIFAEATLPRNGDPNVANANITLAGTEYQGLTDTAFSIYFFGQATGAGANIDIDDIYLTAVPEPSAVAILMGLATLGFVVYRRRRR